MKHKSIAALVVLLSLSSIFYSGCLNPSTEGNVDFTVQVHDPMGDSLSGVKLVSDNEPEGQSKLTGLTDNSGKVTFKAIKTGHYRFDVSRYDYNPLYFTLTVDSEDHDITVEMNPTAITLPPTITPVSVTFSQLTGQPDSYNKKYVTFDGYYFGGFEITALASALSPASYNASNVVPVWPLIWVKGSLGRNAGGKLHTQTGTPSGYPEYFGKVKVTGQFQYGSKYGHMDAYQYQIIVITAEYIQ